MRCIFDLVLTKFRIYSKKLSIILKVLTLKKVLIFGNSGSGKSTYAKNLSLNIGLAHLDLDTVAFQTDNPIQRKPIQESMSEIIAFIEQNDDWVIEGCYGDLILCLFEYANDLVFLNLPVELCQENANNRPWEPHKYQSKAAQDKNLPMLLDWIAGYYQRDDTFSFDNHNGLYERFKGSKKQITSNCG